MPYRSYYRLALNSLVFAGVSYFLFKSIDEVLAYQFQFTWFPLFLSLGLLILSYLSFVWTWRSLALSFGLDAPLQIAGKAWSMGQLGKYVPGKITALLLRFEAYRGYSKQKITLATGIEYLAMLAAASLLVLLAVAVSPDIISDDIRCIAAVAATLLLFALWPRVSFPLINILLKLLKRAPLTEFPSFTQLLRFVGIYMLTGILQGTALYLILNALSPINVSNIIVLTGIYEAAGLIGIAALFAPGGIGVREGILLVILPMIIPKPLAIVGTILMRLMVTIVEIVLAGMFVISSPSQKG